MSAAGIIDTIAELQHSFRLMRLEPPAALLLASNGDGHQVLAQIRQTNRLYPVTDGDLMGKAIEMADGSIYMEIEVRGMKIRWPANRLVVPDGSTRFI